MILMTNWRQARHELGITAQFWRNVRQAWIPL